MIGSLRTNQIGSPRKIRTKRKHFWGTFNVNTLFKTGKQIKLMRVLEEYKIRLLAIQETRFISDEISTMGIIGY